MPLFGSSSEKSSSSGDETDKLFLDDHYDMFNQTWRSIIDYTFIFLGLGGSYAVRHSENILL